MMAEKDDLIRRIFELDRQLARPESIGANWQEWALQQCAEILDAAPPECAADICDSLAQVMRRYGLEDPALGQ